MVRRRNPERVRAWRQLIADWKQSGQTINAFCRERNLTRSSFDRCRRILAAETDERAIRPIAVGRANWLQIGGGGLSTASVC